MVPSHLEGDIIMPDAMGSDDYSRLTYSLNKLLIN